MSKFTWARFWWCCLVVELVKMGGLIYHQKDIVHQLTWAILIAIKAYWEQTATERDRRNLWKQQTRFSDIDWIGWLITFTMFYVSYAGKSK